MTNTPTINKVVRIGTIKQGNRWASIYCHVNTERHYLSMSGVIGPLPSGNALGGCGQIDMEFMHRNNADNDKRYINYLIKPSDIHFAKAWNKNLWLDYLDIWKKYHMEESIPQEVIDFFNTLPDTDRKPAWF